MNKQEAPAVAGRVERPVRRRRMTIRQALLVLMDAASRDNRGAGLGMRTTSDAWREKLAEAWAVAHRKAYGWEPDESAYRNAGFAPPNLEFSGVPAGQSITHPAGGTSAGT